MPPWHFSVLLIWTEDGLESVKNIWKKLAQSWGMFLFYYMAFMTLRTDTQSPSKYQQFTWLISLEDERVSWRYDHESILQSLFIQYNRLALYLVRVYTHFHPSLSLVWPLLLPSFCRMHIHPFIPPPFSPHSLWTILLCRIHSNESLPPSRYRLYSSSRSLYHWTRLMQRGEYQKQLCMVQAPLFDSL